jgi:hypothetical protein
VRALYVRPENQIMNRVIAIIYLSLILASASSTEQENAVIPSGAGIHIYDAGPIDGSAPKLVVAPLFPSKVKSLGDERIFDLRGITKSNGVDLNPDELVLYSPQSRLVFCRASREKIDMIRQLYESHEHDLTAYQFTLVEGLAEPIEGGGEAATAARRIVMRGSSVSGAQFEVAFNESQSFSMEFVVDGSGKRIDATVNGTLQLGETKVKISTRSVSQVGKDILLFERATEKSPSQFDRLILRLDAMPDEDQLHHDEDWQRAQAGKIALELAESKKSNKP